jgi:hypothetical protein
VFCEINQLYWCIQAKEQIEMGSTACAAVILLNLCFLAVRGASLASSGSPWAKHHNYEEMLAVLEAVHRKCPEITYLYNLTGHPDHTIQGRNLPVLVISDHPSQHEVGKHAAA